ncbi:glycosyl hydrolase [Flavobacterium magnum]|uniref:Glycosyl hydrolase n=1 Tax=Flavobacterium magnum TaxID=2162713 RepID=A0A2S0RC53_9FLAO|nr:TIM-barrel domain-containing protein [Flavobacterium magnum]AWA29577.1 glycosyl hydrolase [Flavobacterium magnum]
MKKNLLLISFFVSLAVSAQPARAFRSFKKTDAAFIVTVSDGEYRFRFYNTSVVETTFLPIGETFNPESHAVVLSAQKNIGKASENGNRINLVSAGISVSIQKSPFRIAYSYKGKSLLSEKNGYAKKSETGSDGKTQQLEMLDFNLDQDEALYGGGARVLGMNRRGNRLQLYNRASYGYGARAELMNFTMPLVFSSKIYAVHFDNAAIGYLDLDSQKNNTLAYETISGRKTYQVVAADNWATLIESYTALTGRQPMPPRWALGNFSSRFGYRDQEMAEKTAQHFRDDNIPVDAMIFDLYWFGKTIKGTMGNLEFDREVFPYPENMIEHLNQSNIKTILITEPFILTSSKKWQEAVDKKVLATDASGKPFTYDFYFGHTGLIDVFKPEAREWFWDIYKGLAKKGVAGVWGDLGEPEVFPSEAFTVKGKADEVHNIYGHNWAKMVFEGYKKDFPGVRPFILMRSGYSGSQRYGMIPWSGDVSRSWDGLSGQMEIALEMGMQGMGYMHSDLGGFAGEYNDNDLYIRWLQYGVFQPIFRPHAQELVASEPVYKDLLTKAQAKQAIEMRYRLLPYNYTLSFENHRKGTPLMRPLFFDEPGNQELLKLSTNYLWGRDFLVAPVIQRNAPSVKVYFPKGSNWIDLDDSFRTIETQGGYFEGGQSIDIPVTMDHIPVFVRGGAFVPMSRVVQHTEAYDQDKLQLHYFFDPTVASSDGLLYLDDGKTADAFEKGQYELMKFHAAYDGKTVTITITEEFGKTYNKTAKSYEVYFHNPSRNINMPVQTFSNGQPVPDSGSGNYRIVPVTITAGQPAIVKFEMP